MYLDVVADNVVKVDGHRQAEALGLGAVYVWAHVDLLDGSRASSGRDAADLAKRDSLLCGDDLSSKLSVVVMRMCTEIFCSESDKV